MNELWSPGWMARFVKSKKRARKLRKRGENIFWSPVHRCWIWEPKQQQPSAEGDGNE